MSYRRTPGRELSGDPVLLLPPAGVGDLVRVGPDRRILAEVFRRRADAVGDGTQDFEVEVVDVRCRLAQELAGVLDGDVGERRLQALDGVGPGALGMGVVG